MNTKDLFIVLAFICLSSSRIILDSWGTYTTSVYNCLKNYGYDKIILKIDSRQWGIDQNDAKNIYAAKNAGFTVEPALTPCVLQSPQSQALRIIGQFQPGTFQKVWAVPWQTSNSCKWQPFYPSKNCQYLLSFISAMKTHNITVGVSTNRLFWSHLFGGIEGCPQANIAQLWWEPVEQQVDFKPDFNSYKRIGGWDRPFMKQYKDTTLCGVNVDYNFYQ